ncbi:MULTISPECIES: DUF1543 domain-containing protein [unclassified Pseudomonas]|uniref:DUF1543 domain-containing protein n=1 Tax=unclassified Pseudomonas TaxID=196821 RepID=UPI000BCFD62A|nr:MULTISPECIES: DUF1543 domain-containing protein [unclassified Pseudomonas]PVZ19803.1 uncharacterized protein DUF1543 [Pseudomonas sp. URIL14HWK12:I12]PVZ26869.1 uncharacterized protein DUF1543 [Pseudomonas sp. URIL14HWK12:I10]PVZ37758.1 uncharacterized protein DUF1543 [Pseudomonas sp. URIL14HWK12:I11]SNZ05786.1 protein of unknown function [Pseudomonas sp. URIL14HWK12:I9]
MPSEPAKKLFVIMLGGKHPRAKIEVHDVAFVVAPSLEATFPALREGWFGSQKGLHIDAWMAVDGIDEWKVQFSPVAPGSGAPRLFFINLGGYDNRAFGEAHQYVLIVAPDKRAAIDQGRQRMLASWKKAHTDAVMDIDDCLPIDEIAGRYVHLVQEPHRGIIQQNDYIVL